MEPINAVEMVRRIRDEMYEETKDLSSEEFMEYIAREAQKLYDAEDAHANLPPAPNRSAA